MKNLFSKTSKAKKNAKAISHNPLLERKVRRGYRRYRAVIVGPAASIPASRASGR